MNEIDLFNLYATLTLDTSGYEQSIQSAETKSSSFFDVLKANVAGSFIVDGIKKIGSAFVSVGEQALMGYADAEQLVGGIDTLFKDSSATVQEYAANAYKTAGLTANEYMETVTAFSASLLQSLDNDTEAAAEKANTAITDMADNANKMGTSMELIQNAYRGFAKSNYTMLDNLALGYGGTKEEMERLLEDAEKISGIEYDISSYSDIVDAIHVIQTEMGITGTTAAEAADTISGSLASMKSAWGNLISGLGNENMDTGMLVDNFIDSVEAAAGNILPRIEQIIVGIVEAIPPMLDGIASIIPSIASSLAEGAPALLEAGKELLSKITTGIEEGIPALVEHLPEIIEGIGEFFNDIQGALGMVLEAGGRIIVALVKGIVKSIPVLVKNLPEILDALVSYFDNTSGSIAESGVKMIGSLISGLLSAIGDLVDAAGRAVNEGILTPINDKWQEFVDAGANLLKGIWQGISDTVDWLKSQVSGVVDRIKGWFTGKDGFDEHSPSKWGVTVGEYLMQGLAIGVEDAAGNVYETVEDIVDEIKSRMNSIIDVLDLRQDVGDLQYELWEKTEGADATDAEKYAAKLEILTRQQEEQGSVVETVAAAYDAAVEQYGEANDSSLELQKTLLEEQIAYADLKAEIEEVTAAMEELNSVSGGSVSFSESSLGKATEASINATTTAQAEQDVTLNATLIAPDGTKFANYYLPSFIKSAAANGTPIANAQTA